MFSEKFILSAGALFCVSPFLFNSIFAVGNDFNEQQIEIGNQVENKPVTKMINNILEEFSSSIEDEGEIIQKFDEFLPYNGFAMRLKIEQFGEAIFKESQLEEFKPSGYVKFFMFFKEMKKRKNKFYSVKEMVKGIISNN